MGRYPKPRVEVEKGKGKYGPRKKMFPFHRYTWEVWRMVNGNKKSFVPYPLVVEVMSLLSELIAEEGGKDIVKVLLERGIKRNKIKEYRREKNEEE